MYIFLGHFTQEIWIGSTELGIGVASYEDNGWNWEIVVANYYPPGNIQTQFKENVLARRSVQQNPEKPRKPKT